MIPVFHLVKRRSGRLEDVAVGMRVFTNSPQTIDLTEGIEAWMCAMKQIITQPGDSA
jgi:hypothetical protein